MTLINKSAVVRYKTAEMFALVDNISSYPEFLSWCSMTVERKRTDDEVLATIEIAHAAFRKSFTLSHYIQKNKKIEMRLVEGPFNTFVGLWNFDPIEDDGCKVSFELEYQFSNRLLGLVAGPLFDEIANSLVDQFAQRAKQVYGIR